MGSEVVRGPAFAGRPLEVADETFDGGDHAETETGSRRAVGRLQQVEHVPGVPPHRAEVAQVAGREVRVEQQRAGLGRRRGG